MDTITLTILSPTGQASSAVSTAEVRNRVLKVLPGLMDHGTGVPNADHAEALEILIAMDPQPVVERFTRGWIRFRTGDRTGWEEDWRWVRTAAPEFFTSERVAACLAELHARQPAWKTGLPVIRSSDQATGAH